MHFCIFWNLKVVVKAWIDSQALTYLSENYDFVVVSNQHDGLITIHTIPSQAVEDAIVQSGLKFAKLIEKPLM
jgi:hypothetical protein